jgi:pyruvate kinase
MLSGETTVGKHPVRCVEFLNRIATEAERTAGLRFCEYLDVDIDKQHMAASAVQLAEALKVRGIVVITRRGLMANYVANCRPRRPTIFAFSSDPHTCQQLALNYGTQAYRIGSYEAAEQTLAEAFAQLRDSGSLAVGDKVVVLSDILAADGIDAVSVQQIPPAAEK